MASRTSHRSPPRRPRPTRSHPVVHERDRVDVLGRARPHRPRRALA
jgi:hypothetical protein